jgi:glycosyltransferase involved in cell wall biosynthesis
MIDTYHITVAIVVYNGAATIRETIKSISRQTYKNIELIVIDGNSTDGTKDILVEYDESINFRISEPDSGIYDAMNKALRIARGDWILFLGCDDTLYSNYTIDNIVNKLKRKDAIYYGRVVRKSDYKSYEGRCSKIYLQFRNICHQAIFYPRCIYKNEFYNTKYKIYADYEYNIRVFNKIRFIFINEIISIYNTTGISSHVSDVDFNNDKEQIIYNNYSFLYLCIYRLLAMVRRSYKCIKSLRGLK